MRGAWLLLILAARPAFAGVVPDPGGAGAWATGGALLADPSGPLTLFDAPARLAGGRFVLAAQRARLFELDDLGRTRVAIGATRDAWSGALGYEAFGPVEARRTRAVAGLALGAPGRAVGMAWNERRGAEGEGRAGALDLAACARVRAVTFQLAARGVLAGGDPAVQADPDWTIEAAGALGPARAHLARTRDLHGTRTGGGVALAAGPLAVSAGALGPPWSWTLGFLVGAAHARAGFARVVHPVLGASDVLEGGAAW
jgi:hypothetical protein